MDQPALSATLTAYAFAFILVMCRCGSAVMMLPPFAEDGPPALLRTGFAMALTLLLLPAVAPHVPPQPASFATLVALIANELLCGGLLGWLARLVCLSLPAAGQIMALSTGLSSVLQADANFGAQSSGLGNILGRLVPVAVLVTGLYALPLEALAGSYDVLPIGGATSTGDTTSTGDITTLAVGAPRAPLAPAVRLAAPFLLIGTIWQVALGLLSRLVPQIQIYFAALPGQVLGGLLLLAMLSGGLCAYWAHAVATTFSALPGA
jgi:flagellar biosynthetic protein FliR